MQSPYENTISESGDGAPPAFLATLPDGREALTRRLPEIETTRGIGRSGGEEGLPNGPGLAQCRRLLQRFGAPVGQDELSGHAAREGLRETAKEPRFAGAMTLAALETLLAARGLPAHLETLHSLEDLAQIVEIGLAALIPVNAGLLWDRSDCYADGAANYPLSVEGTARDPQSLSLLGFFIAEPEAASRFVTADALLRAWLEPGGQSLITDLTAPPGENFS